MDYLKPYVHDFITDSYGTAVGVINPNSDYKVVIEGTLMKFLGTLITSPKMD